MKFWSQIWRTCLVKESGVKPVITTPRLPCLGVVMTGFTPDSFTKHVRQICDQNFKSDYIFVKSWNEWAEGNTLEPDQQYGEEFLKILQQCNR